MHIIKPSLRKFLSCAIIAVLLTISRDEFALIAPRFLSNIYEAVWFIFVVAAIVYMLGCLVVRLLLSFTNNQIKQLNERIDKNKECDLLVPLCQSLQIWESNKKILLDILRNKSSKDDQVKLLTFNL